jgi:DNA invertase Pin-like site-specific DNA recombinase
LLSFLAELHAKHVDLYLHQQGVDTTTPAGRALFSMCGVFAEFERSMIQERVKAGLARARAAGKILGRPKVSAEVEAQVRALHANGIGKVRLAKQLGIGVSAVQRIIKHEFTQCASRGAAKAASAPPSVATRACPSR